MNIDVRIMLEPFCVSKNERQSAVKILLELKGQFLVMEIRLTFPLIYFYDWNILYLLSHVVIIFSEGLAPVPAVEIFKKERAPHSLAIF